VPRFRVFRTSSFRLALMYAALTGISFLVLLAVVFLSTTRFMRHQIDDSVANEIEEIFANSPNRGLDALRPAVVGLTKHPSGFLYLLQDSGGVPRAGNLPPLNSKEGVREWPAGSARSRSGFSAIRGRGIAVDGGYLFVGWSTHQLLEMEEMVIGSFAWGLAASIALALVGGLIMGGRLMQRIETISNNSRSIIGEGLRQRLPVTQTGDELDHLTGSINAMLDRIEGLMTDLRQVTTDIAHDLRTPLTRLRQRLELATRPDAAIETVRATLDSAVTEVDTILSIFSALLRIAQIEGRTRRAGFQVVGLSDLMSTTAELYRSMADDNGQILLEAIEPSLMVKGERELLMQLFANLIENALRHSPRGAAVRVNASRFENRVRVSIVDNGRGIPQDERCKVLQRFYRLEASRTTVGNGLGLSLANAIAELHDTTLELSDAEPGLCVSVSLEASQ
jgi:signal transduction histidine kinase